MSTLNIYSKEQADQLLSTKANSADVYTKTQVDSALASKQDVLTAGTGITISNNVISATGGSSTSYVKSHPIVMTYISNGSTALTSMTPVKNNYVIGNDGYITAGSNTTLTTDEYYSWEHFKAYYKSIVHEALTIKGTPSGTYYFKIMADATFLGSVNPTPELLCTTTARNITVTISNGEITAITYSNVFGEGALLSNTEVYNTPVFMEVYLIPVN